MYVACTKCLQVSIDGICFRVVDFSTTDQQVQKIGFVNTLGTKSTYSYVDVDNLSASPENRQQMHETCQELVWKLQAKLVKFCTKLHTSKIQANKKKNPILTDTHAHTPQQNRKRTLVPSDAPTQKALTNTQDECLCFRRPSSRCHL